MLSKENEQFEDDLKNTRGDLEHQTKDRRKLERVLRDAAGSMQLALSVSHCCSYSLA